MGVKMQLLRSSNEELVRAMQLVQLALDRVPDSNDKVSAYITKNYTVASDVDFVFADPSGGAITVTLPKTGTFTVTVRNTTSSPNAVSVQMASAAKINGINAIIAVPQLSSVAFRYNSQTRGWFTV